MGRIIEISKKKSVAGRVPATFILHEIYDDDTQYNKNGISWQNPYIEQNIESVKGMPLVAQFLDGEKTIPFGGHGELNVKDGDVTFEDSLVVGTFEEGYIDEVEVNGKKIKAALGKAYIYEQRFPHLVQYLRDEYNKGNPVESSIEICADKSEGNKQIVYAAGYKVKGRIPSVFDYSGHAILVGETPSDDSALMIELNNYKKEANATLKDVTKGKTIELSELNYDDASAIIIRAFNKLMKTNSDDYYYDGYFIHRLFPVSSRAIMKKYGDPGKYYMVPYTIKNTEIILGDVVEAEEDWKPVDENPVEINISVLKDMFTNKKGGKKMEGILKEKESKIEALTTQVNELNSKNKELDDKVTELNSTLVEVNKVLEAEKKGKEELTTEVNSLRDFKSQEDEKAKKAEINSYFENEVKKNGFTDVELNSLKSEYVDKMDLDGLKSKEAELCVKKIKEINTVQNSTETNSVDKDLFMTIHNNEKSEDDVSDLF